MNKKISFYAVLMSFILCFFRIGAQTIKFEKVFGTQGYDYARSVIQTFDGGYVVAGATNGMNAENANIYLVKLDSLGDIKWAKELGGPNIDWAYSVRETNDSGFIIAGYTNSLGAGGYDVFLVKTDSGGNELWNKTYGGSDWDVGYSVKQTNDTGYIIVGKTYSFGAGNSDIYLIKTDNMGDTIWTKTFGGDDEDVGKSVWLNTDNGYFIAGHTKSYGVGNEDVYFIRTDINGDTLWTNTVGGTGNDFGNSGQQTSDGGFIIGGNTNSFGMGDYDWYVIKVDENGGITWTQTSGYPDDDFGLIIIQTFANDFLIGGYLINLSGSGSDMFLSKIFYGGIPDWSRTYGSTEEEIGYSLEQTMDSGFILIGHSFSYGLWTPNIYIIKTDSLGFSTANVIINVNINELDNPYRMFTYIFSNPSQQELIISIPANVIVNENGLTLKIYGATGQEIQKRHFHSAQLNTQKLKIRLGEFHPGLYFISLTTSDLVYSGKFIIH